MGETEKFVLQGERTQKARLPERTREFVQDARARGVLEDIDRDTPRVGDKRMRWEKGRDTFLQYVFNDASTLEELKEIAGVTTIEGVRQVYLSTLKAIWKASPADIQQKFPAEEVLTGKRSGPTEVTPEFRAKIGTANRGSKHSEEARANMSAAQLGRMHSPETRAKISAALIGKPGGAHSPEHKAKLSAALKGKRRSEETKLKIRATLQTSETKLKMSQAHMGKPLTPEHRAKIAQARKAMAEGSEMINEGVNQTQQSGNEQIVFIDPNKQK